MNLVFSLKISYFCIKTIANISPLSKIVFNVITMIFKNLLVNVLRICITISNIIYCSLENCIINQKISMCIPFKNLKTLISVTVCLLIPTPRYLYFILNQSSVPEKLLFFSKGTHLTDEHFSLIIFLHT